MRAAKLPDLNQGGKGVGVDLLLNPSIHGHLQHFLTETARRSGGSQKDVDVDLLGKPR
jgi:hypothetical protein